MAALRAARREVDEVRADLRKRGTAIKVEEVQQARRRLAGAAAEVAKVEP